MIDQPVLRVLGKIMIPFILLFGCYVITHGELGPGGGFQGGVILASAFILYALIFGMEAERRVLPQGMREFLMVGGILLYAGIGVVAMLMGGKFLDYSALDLAHPQGAEAHGMTFVETGVGLTVMAVMVTIFNKMAERR